MTVSTVQLSNNIYNQTRRNQCLSYLGNCSKWNLISSIKKKKSGMIVNVTTFHQRLNDIESPSLSYNVNQLSVCLHLHEV